MKFPCALACFLAGLGQIIAAESKPTLSRDADRFVVAADGSGDFRTVQAAVDFVGEHRAKPVVIFIKKGRYEELVRIGRERTNIHLVGEDRAGTVITFTNNDKLNPGWIQRSVLGVEGDGFELENLTVHNTTPYKGSQAEAVYVNADRCVLRNANFVSYQDTLNLGGRVYVANCYIEGDVDYVWGYGTAVLERCELHTMHDGYIVQARNPATRAGYIFINCTLTASPEVKKVWLARIDAMRFPASQVAFIHCAMGDHILPAGWQVTGGTSESLRFHEVDSTNLEGKPLDVTQRNPVARQLAPKDAAAMSVVGILGGHDAWNPTGR